MKRLTLTLGIGVFIAMGVLPVGAFLDYSPNCVESDAYTCANPNPQTPSNPTSTSPTPNVNPNSQTPNNPTPATPTPQDPISSPSTPIPPTASPQGQAGLHVYYESTAGHHIYAQQYYKGQAGELVDLSRFQKELVTFEFDHYEPKAGTITLQAGRNLKVTLVYRKKFRELSSQSPVQPSPSLQTSSSATQSPKTINTTSQEEQEKTQIFTALFDNYFKKNSLTSAQKKAFLSVLKMNFESAKKSLTATEKHHEATYDLILKVIDSYNL